MPGTGNKDQMFIFIIPHSSLQKQTLSLMEISIGRLGLCQAYLGSFQLGLGCGLVLDILHVFSYFGPAFTQCMFCLGGWSKHKRCEQK